MSQPPLLPDRVAATLGGTMRLFENHLSPLFVGAAARARLAHAGNELPAALARCLYVECRPGAIDDVDLIVDVAPEGREILAGRNPVIALPDHLIADPAWRRVQRFAAAWLDDRDGLTSEICDAWIELDLSGGGSLHPNVFVDLAPSVARGSSSQILLALRHAATHLDFHVSSSLLAHLERCLHAIPDPGIVLYAGFMLARHSDMIRLCVMGLTPDEVVDLVQATGWDGDTTEARALMTRLAAPDGGGQPQPAIVHLDIGRRSGTLGLEYPFARRPQVHGALAEGALLDTLVAGDWLSPTQRAALGAWPGVERRTMPHELWPSILVRRVNHVKFTLRTGSSPQVKVYLCAEHAAAERVDPSRARGQ